MICFLQNLPPPRIKAKCPAQCRSHPSASRSPKFFLLHAGGSARTRDAISGVGKTLKNKLSKADLAPLPSTGQTRWIVNVRFARLQLKNLGLILADKTPGIWELTEAGKRWAANDKPIPANPIPQDKPKSA